MGSDSTQGNICVRTDGASAGSQVLGNQRLVGFFGGGLFQPLLHGKRADEKDNVINCK